MAQIPSLSTPRLLLRPFDLDDAPAVRELAGAYEIAEMTANIPHPYEMGMAETWIFGHQDMFDEGRSAPFAITLKLEHTLIGAISLMDINRYQYQAELGYWIGKPYWNQGYCTEAARRVIQYGFEEFDLNRIEARHMTKNPASGRVMQKLGMQFEGILRESIYRWDRFEDAAMYSILRYEFQSA